MANNKKAQTQAVKTAQVAVAVSAELVEGTTGGAESLAYTKDPNLEGKTSMAAFTSPVTFKKVPPVVIPERVVTRQSKCVTILPGQLADLAAIIIAANEKLGILNPDGTARIKHKIIFETEPSGKKDKQSAIKSIVMSAEAEENEIPTPLPTSTGNPIDDAVAAGNDQSFHQEEE